MASVNLKTGGLGWMLWLFLAGGVVAGMADDKSKRMVLTLSLIHI